ncbi:AsmA family protein [Roseococcus pinisoli]|uniref:AsmA family protein n=1 Tax=Roseococcus pinisoli TaxID=2835040 RepID=A0ABS5Q7Q5_9PROT|nr:AsmA family protein [Roseococcus pinisoli]MBS7809712.1 AsmA family protein [Roseococcus pinisoli]
MKKILLIVAAVIVAIPVLAIGGFLLFFDADSFRPRLAQAVQDATGREFRIEGPLRLSPALTPTVSVNGLSLANIPGGSSPEMLRIAHAELRLGLIALIGGRIEVASLTLEGGRLLLEKQNWQMGRAPAPAPATPAPAAAPSRPLVLDIRSATLKDWVVTYEGEEIRVPQARLTGTGADSPLDLTATIVARGAETLLEGRIGPPMRFAAADPWPFRLSAVLPGARVSAEGRKTGNDWQAALSADVPRLEALSALAGRPLPALTGIDLRAQAALTGGVPSLAGIEGRIGGGEIIAGLVVTSATVTQASLQGPSQVAAAGTYRGQPVTLQGEFLPAALQAGTPGPVTLRLGAAGANFTLQGSWPGELTLEGTAPDLAALAALAQQPLPPLRDVTLRATVAPIGDRFAQGARIGQFALASSGGDLGGALELQWAPRPSVKGRLTSTRLDVAAFRPGPATAPAGPAPAAPAAAPPPPPASGRLIPDIAVDVAPLRLFDADLTFDLAELRNGALTARQVRGHLVNQAGAARLDPFSATLPGGTLNLRLAADANATPPALQGAGGGQGLDPVALLRALGIQSPLSGRTDLAMDLRGQGATTRALAATATGHLGLAVTEGRLSGRPAQTLAQIPGLNGEMTLSCLAIRAEADRGIAAMRPLYLEGAPGRLGGEGTLNLRDETLSMRFTTDLRVAGVRLRAPVPLTGTLAAPRLEMTGVAQGALAGELGDRLERAIPGIGGFLPQQSGGPSLPDCASALAAARGGRPGPVPAAREAPAPAHAPAERRQPDLNNLLRGILGR